MIKMKHALDAGKETTPMSKSEFTLNSLALLLCFFTLSSVAFAQRDQTFVRIAGDNNNPCTRGEPCRTFAGALAKTNPGGEIIAVDTGEYNPVVIDKPVTITAAPGVTATVTATSGEAVKIDNMSFEPSQIVTLRGLTITGRGASVGIRTDSQGILRVENCVVSGFSSQGILVLNDKAFIQNTVASGNGSAPDGFDGGIEIASGTAIISNSQLTGNRGAGLVSNTPDSNVIVHDSVVSGNTGDGITARNGGEVNVERCIVSGNTDDGIALSGGGVGVIRVSNSTVMKNGDVGLLNGGATFHSRGNNTVTGNRLDTQGTIQTFAPR